MYVDTSSISCGVKQLYSIDIFTIHSLLEFLINANIHSSNTTFCLFSDSKHRGRGTNLAAIIRKHKLGSISKSLWRKNYNSGSHICVWVWAPPSLKYIKSVQDFIARENVKAEEKLAKVAS